MMVIKNTNTQWMMWKIYRFFHTQFLALLLPVTKLYVDYPLVTYYHADTTNEDKLLHQLTEILNDNN